MSICDFVKKYYVSIHNLFESLVKDVDSDTIQSVIEELSLYIEKIQENNCYTEQQLFYIANEFLKEKAKLYPKYSLVYLCPGCLYLGEESILDINDDVLDCTVCKERLQNCKDNPIKNLYLCFSKHNKLGYRCVDCNRFMPKPLISETNIKCPYLDCLFTGDVSILKSMRHPSSKKNLSLCCLKQEKKIVNYSSESIYIKNIIEQQKNLLPYSKSTLVSKHNFLAYQAFENLLVKYPDIMVDYFLNNSRKGGVQSKAFQEYVYLLENSFPLIYFKNKKRFSINSLLDDNLCVFNGLSIFKGEVNNGVIKNNTSEFYIGGRKGAISKPFYIGKLIDVIDSTTQLSLLDNVIEYTFLQIKLLNIKNNTPVEVIHLRVPPHYQMGAMVYINRVRKKIINEILRTK
jgi:hypothetical protein